MTELNPLDRIQESTGESIRNRVFHAQYNDKQT